MSNMRSIGQSVFELERSQTDKQTDKQTDMKCKRYIRCSFFGKIEFFLRNTKIIITKYMNI